MPKESRFQAKLIKKLHDMFPEGMVFKTDASYIQGTPDILILNDNKWAALECKKSATAKHRPNQDYYVDKMNKMSFAAFIYPENEKEILDAIQRTLQSDRTSCISKS